MFTTDIQTICDHLLMAEVVPKLGFLHAITKDTQANVGREKCVAGKRRKIINSFWEDLLLF
jgi:hypothetical protein